MKANVKLAHRALMSKIPEYSFSLPLSLCTLHAMLVYQWRMVEARQAGRQASAAEVQGLVSHQAGQVVEDVRMHRPLLQFLTTGENARFDLSL